MKTKKFAISTALSLLTLIILSSCGGKYKGFDETDNGLYYQIVEKKSNETIPIGDYAIVQLVYKINDDSVIYDTRMMEGETKLKVRNPIYKGDINEAFSLLGVGDSARFIVPADSFFIRNIGMEKLPPIVPKGSMIYFDIKVLGHQTNAEFEKMMAELQEKQKAMNEELQKNESIELEKWLSENKIKEKPLASGLYYIEISKGKGKKAESGKKVSVNYTGRLLNGKVFDTSDSEIAKKSELIQPGRKYEPISFVLGQGQVIRGWDEGISLLSEGGKAKLIIPSILAYGERGAGQDIPPFSTLVFDVELVKVE